jgi:hypothetical protein
MQTGKYRLAGRATRCGYCFESYRTKVQSEWYSIFFVVSSPSITKLLPAHYLRFVAEPFVLVPLGAFHTPTTFRALHAGTLQFFLTDTRILASTKRSQANTLAQLAFTALAGTAMKIFSARFFWQC